MGALTLGSELHGRISLLACISTTFESEYVSSHGCRKAQTNEISLPIKHDPVLSYSHLDIRCYYQGSTGLIHDFSIR